MCCLTAHVIRDEKFVPEICAGAATPLSLSVSAASPAAAVPLRRVHGVDIHPAETRQVRSVKAPSHERMEASARAVEECRGLSSELRQHLKDNGIRGDEQTFIGESRAR
jgi:hypothetical protein